ncbi:hypothetical protein BKA65DRAFT_540842 [Rhexocercosporidium sp. MPI-PUGE-AT-0058]|nr:hypothetical protein BKA65DRAFT_540842 [Rhexocercosporidium sp. MPI-PUGE-AT-0058]
MDPVSSSPTLGVEFGRLPRTPASNRSKNGRAPNVKENSNSGGSLHRRLFDTLRSRSRSPARASGNGSPNRKPMKRRKSIINLLNLSSREPHDDNSINVQTYPAGVEANRDKKNYAELFSNMPTRRRSLGNILLNPTNILGTVTNRVPQKPAPMSRESSFNHQCSIVETADSLDHGETETQCEKRAIRVDNATNGKGDNGTGPLYVKLAEGIIAEGHDGNHGLAPPNAYLKLAQEACDKAEDKYLSCSPDSLRPLLSHSRNETKKPIQTGTPDSMAIFPGDLHGASKEGERPWKIFRCQYCMNDTSRGWLANMRRSRVQPFAKCGSANPPSGLNSLQSCLRNHEYYVRETTPDPYMDKELARRQVHDSRPAVTFREISRSSTLIDLDPDFCQRQEQRSKRYADLRLTTNLEWKSNQEQIAQSIVSTVARMTRNYHSSLDETATYNSVNETDQHGNELSVNLRCCGGFEVDENETWDSVIVGSHLLLQGENGSSREIVSSEDLALLLTPIDEASLPDFDDHSTMPRSSLSETEHLLRLSDEDLFLPSVDEILQDSTVLRSPLEPFFGNRSAAKKDVALDLEKETDFCPEYESFLRRSYGNLNPAPSFLFQQGKKPEASVPASDGPQMLLPRAAKSRQVSSSAFQVRYPGTINLLQHTENFFSMEDALLGLYNYKLADLANFFVYDARSCTIDAQSIDSPLPNPADLKKKGLQLGWIPQLFNITATESADGTSAMTESSYKSGGRSSFCNSGWEQFTHVAAKNEPHLVQIGPRKRPSPSLRLLTRATSEGAASGTNSVFDDDFFLEDHSGGQFSEQASVSGDSSAIRALRAATSEVDVISALKFEGEVQTTKTWVQLAREMRAAFPPKDESVDGGASEVSWRYDQISMAPFEEPEAWLTMQKNGSSPAKQIDDDEDESQNCNSETSSNEKPSSSGIIEDFYTPAYSSLASSDSLTDEMESTCSQGAQAFAGSINYHTPTFYHDFDTPAISATTHLHPASIHRDQFDLITRAETVNIQRQIPETPESAIDHSSGYHFTDVKEHMMEGSEEFERSSAAVPGTAFEVLYDASRRIDMNIESDYSLYDVNAGPTPDEVQEAIEDTCDDPVQNDGSHTVQALRCVLGEANSNSMNHPVLDFTPKGIICCSAAKVIERADPQENEIPLQDLSLRPVGKLAGPSPPTKKGKSKVGALVNIFQDYGLMPEHSRGPLQMSSVSPSFSHQTSRYRVQSSRTSAGSGTVRRISATLSTGSRSAPSPVIRVGMPSSTFDRPQSRISDIDTEASFQFGEVLRRTGKHGESENEESSFDEAEMYG